MSKELFVKAEEGVQRVGYLQALRLQAGAGDERGAEAERFPHHPRTGEQALLRGKILWTAGKSVRREENASVQRQGQGNMVCVLLL